MAKGERPDAPPREWVARAFTRVEDVVYVALGVLLAASAFALLVSAGTTFVRTIAEGDSEILYIVQARDEAVCSRAVGW